MFLNADLLESIEATPDTVLTLVDGRRIVVSDSPDEIAERIVEFRASVLVSAAQLRGASNPVAPIRS
jgi:flagellar protein FlbD